MPTPPPNTRASVARDLTAAGVRAGDVLLVHSSLSSLGRVCGGALAVVQALLDVLGPGGTLVVPTLTAGNRDPSRWTDPAVPAQWWPTIREHLPGFDPATTPSQDVGVITEQVRTWPGALRSAHPQTSFAAIGPRAAELLHDHPLTSHYGDTSPLGRIADAGADVLLLGVPFARATIFHLAEYRQPDPPLREYECVVCTPEGRRWVRYQDVHLDDADFDEIGADFARDTGVVRIGRVGRATTRLFPAATAVAYAQQWLALRRSPTGSPRP